MIGKLLGHRRVETTARYAHLMHESAHEVASRVAGNIAATYNGPQRSTEAAPIRGVCKG